MAHPRNYHRCGIHRKAGSVHEQGPMPYHSGKFSVCGQDGLEANPLVFIQVIFTPLFCDFGSLHIITIQDSLNLICIDIRKHRKAQQICYCTLAGTVWPCKDNNLRFLVGLFSISTFFYSLSHKGLCAISVFHINLAAFGVKSCNGLMQKALFFQLILYS